MASLTLPTSGYAPVESTKTDSLRITTALAQTDKEQDFGDASKTPLKEIWNGSAYATARGLFKKGNEPKEWVGCLDCSVYLGSRAARHRGPVDIKPEPVELRMNIGKPSNGNAVRNVGSTDNGHAEAVSIIITSDNEEPVNKEPVEEKPTPTD